LSLVLTDHLETGSELSVLSSSIGELVQALADLSSSDCDEISRESSVQLARFCSIAPQLMFGVDTCDMASVVSELVSSAVWSESSFFIVNTMMARNPVFKLRFLQLNGWNFLVSMSLAQIPASQLQTFASILALSIRDDFPEPLADEVSVQLVSKLLDMIQSSASFPPAALTEVARGCLYFVSSLGHVLWFVERRAHLLLVSAFPSMDGYGQTASLAVFARLYGVDDVAPIVTEDIPISLFSLPLGSDDPQCRKDAANSLCCVLRSQATFVPQIFESGLYALILELLQTDEFGIRRVLFSALGFLFISLNPDDIGAIFDPNLLEIMEDGRSAHDPGIDDALGLVATALQACEMPNDSVADFLETCLFPDEF
jgi:hypothetical protein